MDKDKFRKIVTEEIKKTQGADLSEPDNWPGSKEKLQTFIKEVDKAHEVYTLENPPKKGK